MRVLPKIVFSILLMLAASAMRAQDFVSAGLQDRDTIVFELSERYGFYYRHRVSAKQTVYRLAKLFGARSESIYDLNPYLRERSIRPGEELIIPVNPEVVITDKTTLDEQVEMKAVYYRVRAQDNIYRISSKYFPQPAWNLLQRNNLKTFGLSVGQLLHVGWIVTDSGLVERRMSADSIHLMRKNQLDPDFDTVQVAVRSSRGIATWNKDHPDQENLYVLHSDARENSVIELIYPMLNRKVYARVLAPIPANIYPEDISIIVSPKVAEALGVRDRRFLVEMRYIQ